MTAVPQTKFEWQTAAQLGFKLDLTAQGVAIMAHHYSSGNDTQHAIERKDGGERRLFRVKPPERVAEESDEWFVAEGGSTIQVYAGGFDKPVATFWPGMSAVERRHLLAAAKGLADYGNDCAGGES